MQIYDKGNALDYKKFNISPKRNDYFSIKLIYSFYLCIDIKI